MSKTLINSFVNKIPTVSVIIPTKNRKEIAGRAILSALNQKSVIVDVIVVNDGSTDGTEFYIQKNYPTVTLINNQTSVGGARARNIGATYAKGQYVAFLDSDDEWLPTHLANKINVLTDQSADGVYGSFYLKNDKESKLISFYESFPPTYKIADKISSFYVHDARTSTFVFKKDSFLDVMFDDELKKHQDWDLAINFEIQYKLIGVNDPTVIIHVDSFHARMSNNLKHEATLYFLEKNMNYFQATSFFNFCIKMVMRCQALNERQAIKPYLDLIRSQLSTLSIKEKIIYFSLKYKILNLNTLRLIRSRFQTAFSKS